MRLPEFTAEASLYRASKYFGFSMGAGRPRASSVTPQSYFGVDLDYFEWVAFQYFSCLPPLCGRDNRGQCHCLTVGFPAGNTL